MNAAPTGLADLEITSAAFKSDPFPYYARMRSEAPVLRVQAPRLGPAWLVTRYDDVAAVLRDERLVKNRAEAVPAGQGSARNLPRFLAPLERGLLSLDGEDHDRLRDLVRQAFTPRRIAAMSGQAERRADELLTAASREGRMDVIADFALPFSLGIIARILGVPDDQTDRFSRWSTALIRGPERRFPVTAVPAVLRFLRYLRGLIGERTQAPQDDLISDLVRAQSGDDRLSDDEILAMVVLLLTAGHETTVNLIASGTLALLNDPEQLGRWRSDPSVAGTGVEELVRYVVPAETATQRYAREDLDIGGVAIRRGSLVLAVLASANRDPEHFTEPDRLDLGRRPNRHLSFGKGAHYCLGAPLARTEARIGLTGLFDHAPSLRLAVAPQRLRWRGGLVLRGLEALPVVIR